MHKESRLNGITERVELLFAKTGKAARGTDLGKGREWMATAIQTKMQSKQLDVGV